MKTRLLVGLLLFQTIAFANRNQDTVYTYLGGAYSLQHCTQLAGQAGFKWAHFGGYVNGIYYSNACFGSEPISNSTTNWHVNVSLAVLETRILNWDFGKYSGYEVLIPDLDRLKNSLEELNAMAKDGATKSMAYNSFRNVRKDFRFLANEYYQVHKQLLNSNVADSWRSLSKSIANLEKDFE